MFTPGGWILRKRQFNFCRVNKWILIAVLILPAEAQQSEQRMTDAWSDVLQNTGQRPDIAPGVQQPFETKDAARDFLDHSYLQIRTDYWRQNTYFTGLPTATGAIDSPLGGAFNPNGIPAASVFQPSNNQIYNFLDFGTRGWLSDRVNTHFAVRYRQDLTHVDEGSPGLDILNTFASNRRVELLSASVEIQGRPSDGWFAGNTLVLGRQSIYSAEVAEVDGASLTADRGRYSYTLFAGRRFSLLSDPDPRAVGGGNFLYRFGADGSLEYDALFYIKGTHRLTYRRRFTPAWIFSTSYKMIGGFPIDFTANALRTPPNQKTTVRLSFFEKLTNKDYFYDYTVNARDLDPHNPLLRLYLGPQSPYSQFVIEAGRTLGRFRLGGSVWIRHLVNSGDQGPFDTSFEDYRADAQIFPWGKIETFLEYHQRNSARLSPFPSTDFFDIGSTGETRIQDMTAEVGRGFAEGRAHVKIGGFYRLIHYQDRFYVLNHLHDRGLLGSATLKLDSRTRAYADYGLDTDFFLFSPNIKYAQTVRLGLDWRY